MAGAAHRPVCQLNMEVEFIANGSQDCPIILIHGSDRRDIQRLGECFDQLANGAIKDLDILTIPGFSSVHCRQLLAAVSSRDVGVQKIGPSFFKWKLTPASWSNVAGLVEPFWREELPSHRHQYLNQLGDISVIMSTDKSW